LGIKTSRHLKLLKRITSISQVRRVWEATLTCAAPQSIRNASEDPEASKFSLTPADVSSHPAQIFVKTLGLLVLMKEKQWQEVRPISQGRSALE
jgi:hypothetical protein